MIGVVIRFYHLGARSFWFDEALSVAYARLSWLQFLKILWAREINMVLYYVLLRPWLHIGSSETAVRALSAIAGALTVPLLFLIGRRLYGPGTGALAALLLSLNAFHIHYSQEARAYSLVTLLLTAATLLLLRAVERCTARRWTAYAVCAAAAVYAHLLAVLVIAAHGLWLLRAERPDWRRVRAALDLFVLLVLPLAPFVWHAGSTPVNWIAPPSFHSIGELFLHFAGSSRPLVVLAVGMWAFAVIRRPNRSATTLLMLWLLLPIAAVAAVSFVRPIFLERYLLFCEPAAALATAAGIHGLRWRPAVGVAAALVVGLTAIAARSAYTDPIDTVPQDFRTATGYLLRGAKPADGIVFYPAATRAGYEVYRGGRPGPQVLYPAHREPYCDLLPEPLVGVIQNTALTPTRVFFYVSQVPIHGRDLGEDVLRAWLARHYRLQSTVQFQNVQIQTFTR